MIKINKIFIVLYISIILISFCGCWDFSELENMALVTGFGMDINENGEVVMTYQVSKPSSAQKQGSATGDTETVIFENTGKTVFDAIRDISMHSSKKLNFTHSNVIVLGEQAAKINPEGLLRVFRRDPESRTIDYVVIAENTASEILKAKGGLDKVQALDLGNLVSDYKASGKIVPTRLTDISMAMLSPTTAPVAPIVRLDDENRSYLSGTAIFHNNTNTMIGSLNDAETRGFLWITNQLKSGSITIKDDTANILVAFEIIGASSSYKANFNNNLTMEIDIKTTISLINNIKSIENITINEAKELVKEVITKKIDMAIKKAQYYRADIFGFGDYLYANHFKQWKTIEQQWENIFATLDYTVKIDIDLKSQGLVTEKFKEK